MIQSDPIVKRLQTMPGVGKILGPVIALEIGGVHRFACAERLASYCGLVPRLFSSGGHTRLGGTSRFVNLYLKWDALLSPSQRHLAEAAYWMLTKEQNYRPPQPVRSAAAVTAGQTRKSPPSSTNGSERDTSAIR